MYERWRIKAQRGACHAVAQRRRPANLNYAVRISTNEVISQACVRSGKSADVAKRRPVAGAAIAYRLSTTPKPGSSIRGYACSTSEM